MARVHSERKKMKKYVFTLVVFLIVLFLADTSVGEENSFDDMETVLLTQHYVLWPPWQSTFFTSFETTTSASLNFTLHKPVDRKHRRDYTFP